jgi:flagellar biosynthesis/type III secretory pathway protein FliH
MGKKHKPPSRIKYEKNNPNWTVRLTKFLFDILQDFLEKSNLSRRDFIAIALKKQEMDYERIITEWYNDGFAEGEKSGYKTGSNDGYNKGCQQGFIDGQKKGIDEGYHKGYAEGLENGKKEGYAKGADEIYEKIKDQNKIWYYCVVCGELIFVEPNSPAHQFIIDMMISNGWKHPSCNPYW